MNKPRAVRDLLTSSVPHLKKNPDALHIFVENGTIVATGAESLSFEYQFDLIVLVTDYADHADTLIVPLLAYVREHQPELLMNPDKRDSGFKFRAEALNHETADIEITLTLTERVVVTITDGVANITHPPEPVEPDLSGPTGWSMAINGVPLDD